MIFKMDDDVPEGGYSFRGLFEELNRVHLSDREWLRILELKTIPEFFERDDGTPLKITVDDVEHSYSSKFDPSLKFAIMAYETPYRRTLYADTIKEAKRLMKEEGWKMMLIFRTSSGYFYSTVHTREWSHRYTADVRGLCAFDLYNTEGLGLEQ